MGSVCGRMTCVEELIALLFIFWRSSAFSLLPISIQPLKKQIKNKIKVLEMYHHKMKTSQLNIHRLSELFKITVLLNPSSQTTEIFPWKCAVTHAPLCFSITVIQHRQHCTCSLQYQRTVPVRVVVIHHLHYLIQNNRHFNIKQIVMRSLGEFLQLIKQEGIKWLQK